MFTQANQTMRTFFLLLILAFPAFAGTVDDLYCETPQAGVVRVHSAPIRYYDETGQPQPINLNWSATADEANNGANVLKSRVQRTSTVTVTAETGETLSFAPKYLSTDASPQRKLPPRNLSLTASGKLARVVEGFGNSIDIEYEPGRGQLKERIILNGSGPLALLPSGATELLIGWSVTTDLTPTLERGGISWRNGTEKLFMAPVTLFDASGNGTLGTYGLEPGGFYVSLPLYWLRSPERVFPIVIDPTVNATTITASVYSLTYVSDYTMLKKILFKFTLPSLSGSAPTSATFKLYESDNSAGSIGEMGAKTSRTDWSTSDSAATLDGLGGAQLSTATDNLNNAQWFSFDVLGSVASSNGVAYSYDQSDSSITVIIQSNSNTGSATGVDTTGGYYRLGYTALGHVTVFDGPIGNNTTNPPYIEITYGDPSIPLLIGPRILASPNIGA